MVIMGYVAVSLILLKNISKYWQFGIFCTSLILISCRFGLDIYILVYFLAGTWICNLILGSLERHMDAKNKQSFVDQKGKDDESRNHSMSYIFSGLDVEFLLNQLF